VIRYQPKEDDMLRTLLKRLMRRDPTPAPTGMIATPANIPVPTNPANDPTPPYVRLLTTRDVLRRNRNDTLVMSGAKVVTKNGAEMKLAPVTQKPPYVICVYRGRRLAVRAENIECYWDKVSEPIQ